MVLCCQQYYYSLLIANVVLVTAVKHNCRRVITRYWFVKRSLFIPLLLLESEYYELIFDVVISASTFCSGKENCQKLQQRSVP